MATDYAKWLANHSLVGKKWKANKPAAGRPAPPVFTVPPKPDVGWQDQPYFDQTAGIGQGLENLKGYLTNAGKGLSSEYGIDTTEKVVPDGVAPADGIPFGTPKFSIADNVDVTNPFSRAALLKRSYRQATAGNTNSMAARGQLYAGALQNAQDETGRQKLGADDSLIKDFAGRFGDLHEKWLQGQAAARGQELEAMTLAQERHKNDPAPPPPPSVNPAAIEYLKDNWQANLNADAAKAKAERQAKAKPPTTAAEYEAWVKKHKLVGGKWVPR